MKVLSIDVGIKNLALCLFNVESKEKYEIGKWDVVSLCNEKVVNCSCGKPAKYHYMCQEDETEIYSYIYKNRSSTFKQDAQSNTYDYSEYLAHRKVDYTAKYYVGWVALTGDAWNATMTLQDSQTRSASIPAEVFTLDEEVIKCLKKWGADVSEL